MVANPPYGNKGNLVLATDIAIDTGKYSTNMQDFFINQGAKVLNQTGFMAFVVPSSFMDQEKSLSKEFLIDSGVAFKTGLRLPTSTFRGTGTSIGTDILTFKDSKQKYRTAEYTDRDFRDIFRNAINEVLDRMETESP